MHELIAWCGFVGAWLLILLMALLSVANAGFRMRRSQQVVQLRRAVEPGEPGAA